MYQFRLLFACTAAACLTLVVTSGCGRSTASTIPTDETKVALLRKVTSGGGAAGAGGDVGTGWGTLKGQFKFNGTPKAPGPLLGFDPNKDKLCGIATMEDESLVVDSGTKGIKNVLVYLRVAPRVHPDIVSAPPKEMLFDQKKCQFLSHVFASSIKDKFVILNTDEAAHNSKGAPGSGNPEFNALIPAKTGRFEYEGFKKAITTPYDITCSIHPWMKAYHIARPDTYFAVTGPDGAFNIPNLPAGVELDFQIWHERGAADKGGLVATGEGAKFSSNGRFKVKLTDGGETALTINVDPAAFQ